MFYFVFFLGQQSILCSSNVTWEPCSVTCGHGIQVGMLSVQCLYETDFIGDWNVTLHQPCVYKTCPGMISMVFMYINKHCPASFSSTRITKWKYFPFVVIVNSNSTSMTGYIDNAMTKFLINFSSHMCIVWQIMIIDCGWLHVIIQDHDAHKQKHDSVVSFFIHLKKNPKDNHLSTLI